MRPGGRRWKRVAVVVASTLCLGSGVTVVVADDEPAAPTPLVEPPMVAPRRPELPNRELRAALTTWAAEQQDIGGLAIGVTRTADADGTTDRPWLATLAGGGRGRVPWMGERYRVLSVTKTLTEALVLRQASLGLVDLDAPMPPLPGVDDVPDGLVITPRMLLQHTSGVVNYPKARGYDGRAPITPDRIVSLGLRSPLLSEPGQEPHYSNTNFHWLGLLLEHTTGRSYPELVGELADELGLTQTAVDAPSRPGWVGYASGGVRSTLPEMVRWSGALFTPGRVLADDELRLLTTVGPTGTSHGLWPVCPCGPGGVADAPTALSQLVADGGLLYLPAHRTAVVVRFDREGVRTAARMHELARLVDAVLTRHGARGTVAFS